MGPSLPSQTYYKYDCVCVPLPIGQCSCVLGFSGLPSLCFFCPRLLCLSSVRTAAVSGSTSTLVLCLNTAEQNKVSRSYITDRRPIQRSFRRTDRQSKERWATPPSPKTQTQLPTPARPGFAALLQPFHLFCSSNCGEWSEPEWRWFGSDSDPKDIWKDAHTNQRAFYT